MKKTTGTLKEMKHDQKIICLWSCSCTGTDAGTGFWKTVSVTNVSYDPTREMFEQYNKIFEDHWKEKTGDGCGSDTVPWRFREQALEVANGLDADVVTLALEYDIESIEMQG